MLRVYPRHDASAISLGVYGGAIQALHMAFACMLREASMHVVAPDSAYYHHLHVRLGSLVFNIANRKTRRGRLYFYPIGHMVADAGPARDRALAVVRLFVELVNVAAANAAGKE